MKQIYLRENTTSANLYQILVREKDFKALEKMQYSGGFKRFEIDIYQEGMKIKPSLKDSKMLSDFLQSVFIPNTTQP
jgi:hypothetical protein